MAVSPLDPFDPNINAQAGSAQWPVYDHALSVEQYADIFMSVAPSNLEQFAKSITNDIRKGVALPPEMQSFATFSLMPEQHAGGVIQVPGIPPEAIRKVARESAAVQSIIGMRCADVQRYSVLSTHVWKPGWRINVAEAIKTPSAKDLQDIKDAERFLLNCNSEFGWDSRKRDAAGLTNFSRFLDALVRDSLTFDGMSIWTDMTLGGKVKAFKTLSTYNIRLATKEGYKGNPDNFAVAVDEAGNIIHVFTRDELVFYTRNTRADADIGGYGWSEIEMAIRIIQGLGNALDSSVDYFNRNAVPNGLLLAKGMFTQRQLDVLSRIWKNLKSGNTKSWALPVIPVPKEGELTLMDLTKIRSDSMLHQDFINLMEGLLCALYKFPVNRLGFRASGGGPENTPTGETNSGALVDVADPGLMPLLHAIECVVNEYLLRSRWPHLVFSFTGKNPKEDAREYEARSNAMVLKERRATADMPDLELLAKTPEEKILARIMNMAPVDPSMSGVFQNLASLVLQSLGVGQKQETGEGNKALFPSKKDPGVSLEHGHEGGVRRDSAAEAASAENSKSTSN